MHFIPGPLTKKEVCKCEEYQTASASELHKLFKIFPLATGHKGTYLRDRTDAARGGKRQANRQTINAGISHNHMIIIKPHKTFC
jgi:hypothetical protein